MATAELRSAPSLEEWVDTLAVGECVNLVRNRDGNPEVADAAAESLVRRFDRMIFSILLRRGLKHQDCADLTQDIWVQVFDTLHQLRDPNAFPGWIRTIACRMHINDRVRRKGKSDVSINTRNGTQDDFPVIDTEDWPDVAALREERRMKIRAAIRSTTPLDQQTIDQFYVQGLTLKGMVDDDPDHAPIGTMKRRLHVARERVRQTLELDDITDTQL